jgi:hypothetical protein
LVRLPFTAEGGNGAANSGTKCNEKVEMLDAADGEVKTAPEMTIDTWEDETGGSYFILFMYHWQLRSDTARDTGGEVSTVMPTKTPGIAVSIAETPTAEQK